jgi:DNA-directed RNA polymerase specialized sigma24 family protein
VPDEEAFDGFVGEVEAGLRRALVAAYGSEAGRDSAMDALVWAWQHWSRVQAMENPGGYLFRVGQSVARRRLRRDARAATVRFSVDANDGSEFEPALERCLAELSSRQRAAVVLVHGYGYTLAEAAQLMGCSVGTRWQAGRSRWRDAGVGRRRARRRGPADLCLDPRRTGAQGTELDCADDLDDGRRDGSDRRVPRLLVEERVLTKEVARAQPTDDDAVPHHFERAAQHDDEFVAGVALLHERHALRYAETGRQLGDASPLAAVEVGEQGNPCEGVPSRITARHKDLACRLTGTIPWSRLSVAPGGQVSHDGFISYSHSADGRLAPALETGLGRFARPWYRRRALDLFRDDTGLSATPQLWAAIQAALDDTRFFILLASPEAAASPWVRREIEHWLATKAAARLRILPVLTDGDLVWDDTIGDYDLGQSTALPAVLAGQFEDEPRHVDLRWARDEEHLDLRHARFRDAVADLAATLHGVSKDEIEGQDVRRHRRTVRLAVAASVVLVVLTLAAVVMSVVAYRAQRTADRSAARADREAAAARRNLAVARSQQLASLAVNNPSYLQSSDTSLLIAVQAARFAETSDAQSALLYELDRSGVTDRLQRADRLPGGLPAALSRDGAAVAVTGESGMVELVTRARGRRITSLPSRSGAPVSVAAGDGVVAAQYPDGDVVVATRSHTTTLETGSQPAGLVFDRHGSRLAALGRAATESSGATVWLFEQYGDGKLRRLDHRHVPPEASDVQFDRGDVVLRTDAGLLRLPVRAGAFGPARVVPTALDPGATMVPGTPLVATVHLQSDSATILLKNARNGSVFRTIPLAALNADAVRMAFSADARTAAVFVTYAQTKGFGQTSSVSVNAAGETTSSGPVVSAAYPQGTYLVLFDMSTLQPFGGGPAGGVSFRMELPPTSAVFGPGARSLLWIDAGGSLHELNLDTTGKWTAIACQEAGRALSRLEYRRLVHEPARHNARACAGTT